jgi:hypothetical protein
MSVGQRYSVVRTFEGRYCTDKLSLGGIFRSLKKAKKECTRRNEADWLVDRSPENILRRDHRFKHSKNEVHKQYEYLWRVLHLGSRTFVD